MSLSDAFRRELTAILAYWRTHAPDEEFGGFRGKIDNDNHAPPAPRKARC